MTRNDGFDSPDTASLELSIQRCIDGALGEAEEQALLRRLESSDDSWRRLALGFVEDRLWKHACHLSQALTPDPSPRGREEREGRRFLPKLLAAAVCLGVAFGAGRWTGPSAGRVEGELASLPRVSEMGASEHPSSGMDTTGTDGPVMYVSLRPTGEEDESSLDVPVYDAERMPAEWTTWQSPALPDQTVQMLRRAGYGVESRRDLMTLCAPDGGSIYLPVESVRVQSARY